MVTREINKQRSRTQPTIVAGKCFWRLHWKLKTGIRANLLLLLIGGGADGHSAARGSRADNRAQGRPVDRGDLAARRQGRNRAESDRASHSALLSRNYLKISEWTLISCSFWLARGVDPGERRVSTRAIALVGTFQPNLWRYAHRTWRLLCRVFCDSVRPRSRRFG